MNVEIKNMMTRTLCLWAAVLSLVLNARPAAATETENLDLRVLPAAKPIVVDGKIDDWDLSGGVFACGDVEVQRDQFAIWFHTAYDAEHFYVLARWRDETPLNNPKSVKGDSGFEGDCLQFRLILNPDDEQRRMPSHWTCWQDRDGLKGMDVHYGYFGRSLKTGKPPAAATGSGLKNALDHGAQMAFTVDADGKGYVQEIAIPWKLLASEGTPAPKTGESVGFTVEPNFSIGISGRLTLKDIFRSGVTLDRVFTFMAANIWGNAGLAAKGNVTPQPVRLSDGREFPVKLVDGKPVADWTDVIKRKVLKGFETLSFTAPADGYVSLMIRNDKGEGVRQLLTSDYFAAGKHEVKWDGLTTGVLREPGQPVEPGKYTWEAMWRPAFNLRLRGWASNSGSAPWDATPTANWGGDHGVPSDCLAVGDRVFLGWSGAEAGKALVCVDLNGKVIWRQSKGGMGAASHLASDGETVFVRMKGEIYRALVKNGAYTPFTATNSTSLSIADLFGADDAPQHPHAVAKDQKAKDDTIDFAGLACGNGKLYLSSRARNTVLEVDAAAGTVVRRIDVPAPGRAAFHAGKLLVLSGADKLLAEDVAGEKPSLTTVVSGLTAAVGVAVDAKSGRIFISTGGDDNQVKVFTLEGKLVAAIGRPGGRPKLGPWMQDGMRNAAGLCVDPEGKLWVAEASGIPKRISIWNAATGAFVRELFGPTNYGAGGGCILPTDPDIMFGQGCEWKLDPATGQATCLATVSEQGGGFSRFLHGPKDRPLLMTTSQSDIRFFERLAPGQWKLRATVSTTGPDKKANPKKPKPGDNDPRTTRFWSDANDDGIEQESEVAVIPGHFYQARGFHLSGYAHVDCSIKGRYDNPPAEDPQAQAGGRGKKGERAPRYEASAVHIPAAGYTACGAPRWDLKNMREIPEVGFPNLADSAILSTSEKWVTCYDRKDGKKLWAYPNTFSSVHGSHYAGSWENGVLRGAFGPIGTADNTVAGALWALNGNCGEWYLFSERFGFVAHVFQGDKMKYNWPQQALPGAILDNVPAGAGDEDFGGTMVQTPDGRILLQAGKTAMWNVELTGADKIVRAGSGQVEISADEIPKATALMEELKQKAASGKRAVVKHLDTKPTFTGNIGNDIGGTIIEIGKTTVTSGRAFLGYDATHLYLGFEVQDVTPWVNGADAPEYLYARGDTVDLQLGTDESANPKRTDPVKGDLRLAIGNFKGKPTAVLYRFVGGPGKKMTFSSGVVANYVVDGVQVLDKAEIKQSKANKGCVVEAAIPLADLGLTPSSGLKLKGDLGMTFSDGTGTDTAVRTYWSNQQTGLVSDEVFELKVNPANWGDLQFE
jgi:hypothetical protein